MDKSNLQINRMLWIDSLKLFSCILVVIGHLYMSMVACGFISAESLYYQLPVQAVYSFHVPIFFVCSGYLYQIKKVEYSIKDHINTIMNKALNLGVPYFTFSIITILMKLIFSSEVNNQAPPLIKTIFLDPIAPYWYLYAMFFIFCLIPRMKYKYSISIALCISFVVKIICVTDIINLELLPYLLKIVMLNAIWFTLGMFLTTIKVKKSNLEKIIARIILYSAIALSAIFYRQEERSYLIQFIIGGMFVISIVYIFAIKSYDLYEKLIKKCSEYFMSVFLLHTICAAAVRVIIIKLGITSLLLHICIGILSSFLLPIMIYEILKKHWFLLFWIEPSKALKERKSNLRHKETIYV